MVVELMDWSKAKNILILAFIVTNMFLFYHVGKDLFTAGDLQLVSDKYIEYVENHLSERGIFISGEIPREIISLPALMVKYQQFEHDEITKLFLGDGFIQVNGTTYEKDQQNLIIESNKKIKYYNNTIVNESFPMNETDAKKISDDFLKQRGFLREDIQLKQIYYGSNENFGNNKLYKMVYHQVYKNRFLGESYIHVYVNQGEVVGFEAMLLEMGLNHHQKKMLIPATVALLRKMNDIINDNSGKIMVKSIEVGYYFNPYDIEFTEWHSIESGTAFPAWKITLENGKIYYVEALKN